ncbi:MAG: hypothetical protein ACPGWR_11970 [Ardenticatenaceae bacterium]
MARSLVFQTNKEEAFSITKLDRKKLYGWKEVVAFDSDGEECVRADIEVSASVIIPKGGKALGILDSDGNWVDRKQLKAVYKDGRPAARVPSSFDQAIKLENTVSIDEFLDYSIVSVYILESEEGSKDLLKRVKKSSEIYAFPFTYRSSYDPSMAFLIESKGNLFMLVGYLSHFEFVGLEQAADVYVDDEDEDDFEDEFDFSMM